MLAWLIVLALISAFVVGAVSMGAVRLPSNPAVIPPPLAPSAVAPSAVAVGPSASPTTSDAAACPARAPVAETRLTPIAVPGYVSNVVVSGCFLWAQIEANNGGIAKIDLTANRVVDTIVPAEIVGPMAIHDGAVLTEANPSIINPGTLIHLIRIDGSTDAVTEVVDLPIPGDFVLLDGQVWVRKYRSGELWLVPLDGSRPAVKRGTLPPFIGSAFGSVWTQPGNGKGLERWEAIGSAPSASIDVGDAGHCVIADHGIACASDSGRIVFVPAKTNAVAWSVQVPGWAGETVSLAAMNGSIWVQPAEIQPGRVDAHELIEFREASGAILRRVELAVRQPLNLWAADGTLWIAGAEQPLARLELPLR